MKIDLFVHDCFLEIGHSNALIETLRNIDMDQVEALTIVSYTSDTPETLFPKLKGRVSHHKVPFSMLKPILLKVIFFHLYAALYSLFHRKSIKISIGIASLSADIVNIQFIHSHWEKFFFKQRKLAPTTYLYKKLLFYYFRICENYLYNKKRMRFSSLSKYVTDFTLSHFKINSSQMKTIYSAVNLDKYNPSNESRIETYHDLLHKYPQLKIIDPLQPIFLFVGAYERKGLPFALQALTHLSSPQIIIVGRPEKGAITKIPENIRAAQINYTTEIHRFYQLCDNFIFPTHYEPYGLVIAEAAAMGMRLYTTTSNVGATEILHDLNEIFLFNTPDQVNISKDQIITNKERLDLRQERIDKVFSKYSWQNAGKEFQSLLNEVLQ